MTGSFCTDGTRAMGTASLPNSALGFRWQTLHSSLSELTGELNSDAGTLAAVPVRRGRTTGNARPFSRARTPWPAGRTDARVSNSS